MMTRTRLNLIALTSVAALLPALAGCVMGPTYKRPEIPVAQEFRYQIGPAEAASLADLGWWEVFNDQALQNLIAAGLANNPELGVAVARIERARALVGVSRSEALPQVGYQVTAGGEGVSVPARGSIDSIATANIAGQLTAAWEFDIWGRIKRRTEAAQANLLAQEAVRRGVLLTLVSDLASGYFRLLRLDRELEIAAESAKVYKETLDLFTLRFEAGRDSRLPAERAKAAYDSANARIADLKREIGQQENALSVLAGDYPRAIVRGNPLTAQTMPPQTPTGLTTDLLRRRPDILGAEQVMIGANAEIGVALANFYPRIGLSTLLGGLAIDGEGDANGTLGLWNILGTVAGPIFTGGRLKEEYNERKAFWDQTIAEYRGVVLVAFRETSDALVAQQTLVARREALESQVVALRNSVDLAMLRYRSGRASYFEVLEAEQQLFPAQDELAQTQEAQLAAVVSLYRALGGGWKLVAPEQWQQAGTAPTTPTVPTVPAPPYEGPVLVGRGDKDQQR